MEENELQKRIESLETAVTKLFDFIEDNIELADDAYIEIGKLRKEFLSE